MKRITYWVMATITLLVLMFSYRTSLDSGFAAAGPGTSQQPIGSGGNTGSGTSASTSASGGTASGTSSGTTAAAGSSGTTSAKSGTYLGTVQDTRWGPVQVQITVANGKITAVEAVQYPNGNHRDEEINSQALPILAQEALAAQSAHIDTVSGATVTSDGYIPSLQAAIDKANL